MVMKMITNKINILENNIDNANSELRQIDSSSFSTLKQ